MEEVEPLYIVGVNIKLYIHFGKVWQFLKHLNKYLLHNLAIPLVGICPSEIKLCIHIKTCKQLFTAGFFAKVGNSPNVHQQVNE